MATLLQLERVATSDNALGRIRQALVQAVAPYLSQPTTPENAKLKALALRFRYRTTVTETATILIPMVLQRPELAEHIGNLMADVGELTAEVEEDLDEKLIGAVGFILIAYAPTVITDKEAAAVYQ